MDSTPPYEPMEHTADAAVRVRGATLEELFANSAFAMFDLQYGLAGVGEDVERVVEVKAGDREMLLARLLTILLSISEAEGLVFKRFVVSTRQDAGPDDEGKPVLRARCTTLGSGFDAAKIVRHIHIKAVTYHMLEVAPEKGYAVIIFDK